MRESSGKPGEPKDVPAVRQDSVLPTPDGENRQVHGRLVPADEGDITAPGTYELEPIGNGVALDGVGSASGSVERLGERIYQANQKMRTETLALSNSRQR